MNFCRFCWQLLHCHKSDTQHQSCFFRSGDLMSSTDQVHLMLPEVMRGSRVAMIFQGQQAQGSILAYLVLPSICKNVETTSGPKMKETPRSFSAQPAMSWHRVAMLHVNRPSMKDMQLLVRVCPQEIANETSIRHVSRPNQMHIVCIGKLGTVNLLNASLVCRHLTNLLIWSQVVISGDNPPEKLVGSWAICISKTANTNKILARSHACR